MPTRDVRLWVDPSETRSATPGELLKQPAASTAETDMLVVKRDAEGRAFLSPPAR